MDIRSLHQPSRPYLSLVSELSHRYPTLNYLASFIQNQRSGSVYNHPVGCAVLEFHKSGVKHVEFNSYSTGTDIQGTRLAQYLSSQPETPIGRLYILEDLSESYIELLGSYLGVDAQVFAAQIHDGHWVEDDRMGHPPKLLSLNEREKSFTLRYYETRVLGRPPTNPVPFMIRTAANVSRNITFQNEVTKGDRNNVWHDGPVATIHRNASFWCRSEQNGGWNALLLLDPAVIDKRLAFFLEDNDNKVLDQTEEDRPYQGGYRDFTPWPDKSLLPLSNRSVEGPRRVSLAEDITYYWLHAASEKQLNLALENPYASTIFLRRIVVSILHSSLRQYYACLSQLETKLWFMERIIDPDLTDTQKNEYLSDFIAVMNEINKIRRRMNWFVHDMNANLEALNLPSTPPVVCHSPSRRAGEEADDDDRDFLVIRDKFASYRTWAEKLLDITSTYLALMETEKSISDSRSLSRLTILGSFFVPVSFVCSFFSMNGEFAVGANKFWVYFAVTLPLVISILVVVFGGWWYKRLKELSSQRYRRVRSSLDDDDGERAAVKTRRIIATGFKETLEA